MSGLSDDLPQPFSPMVACSSPWFTVSYSPWRISRSSTRTCKSLTSSSAVILFPSSRNYRPPPLCGGSSGQLTYGTFQRDRNQLLRLNCKFHRQLLQHVLDEP